MLQRLELPARAAAAPRMVTGGTICFWQGGSLWMGHGQGGSDWHDHHAHQISLPLDGTCRFRSTAREPWTAYTGAFIPSHRKHQFEFEGAIAHLFVEPETLQGRTLARMFAQDGIAGVPDDERDRMGALLQAARLASQSGETLVTAARAALAVLTGGLVLPAPVDTRVLKAITYVGQRVSAPVSLADAAAAAALSPSRFRHVFVQETGSPFRAYLLWLRLNVAIKAASEGASWTNAAHEAGFADSAHFTRTFKRMFGLTPADLSKVAGAHANR